jgi:hypothetical protein
MVALTHSAAVPVGSWSGRETGMRLDPVTEIPAARPRKGGREMGLYMDVHTMDGSIGLADVAPAHQADLNTQDKYDVDYRHYWVDEKNGKIFCLVEAPSAEAAAQLHQEAHGLVAGEIYPVAQGS